MDAIIFLRGEHSKIRKRFALISKLANDNTKKLRFKLLCKDLVRHETMEQKTWYPTLRKYPKLRSVIKHLLAEEKKAAKTIKSFKKTKNMLLWKMKYLKFKHDVNHHAKEEEKKLFPKVRKSLTKNELNALGTQMRKFKARLK